jgi:hypothetical protein
MSGVTLMFGDACLSSELIFIVILRSLLSVEAAFCSSNPFDLNAREERDIAGQKALARVGVLSNEFLDTMAA